MSGKKMASLKTKKTVAPNRKTPVAKRDLLSELLADVEAAYLSGRYLVIVADIDLTRPKEKQLQTRHYTDRFPAGDFDLATAMQKKRFFENLKVA